MPRDTSSSATLRPVANTPTWKFRLETELRDAGIETAQREGEDLSSVLRLAIRAFIADPRALLAACHTIIRGGEK